MSKKEMRKLECLLNDEELARKGEAQATKEIHRNSLKAQVKQFSKDKKAEIDMLTTEITNLAAEISYGKEWRDVECLKQRDETNKKIIFIRADTGEKVSERDMTNKEMQGSLFEDDAAAKADEALGTPQEADGVLEVLTAEPVSDADYAASMAAVDRAIETTEKLKLPKGRKPKLLPEASNDDAAASETSGSV